MNSKITRRELSVQAALLLLGGATITISGCGGGGGTPSNNTNSDRSASLITANHSHAAVITSAQLTAGSELLLSIQGTATHNHVVTLSPADITNIRNGVQVTKTSTREFDHVHDVTFN